MSDVVKIKNGVDNIKNGIDNIKNGVDDKRISEREAFVNASTLRLSEDEQHILRQRVEDSEVDIRPDGLIYYSHVFVRERLNKALGIGQWAIIEHRTFTDEKTGVLLFEGSLYIRGCFVSKAIGQAQKHDNSLQTWGDVYESAKSDCLVRCCKDLGVGKECWNRRYASDWVEKYAVKVPVRRKDGAVTYQWRRKDAPPFWNEIEDKKAMSREQVLEKIANCNSEAELLALYKSLSPDKQEEYKEQFTQKKKLIRENKEKGDENKETGDGNKEAGDGNKEKDGRKSDESGDKNKAKQKKTQKKYELIEAIIDGLTEKTVDRDYSLVTEQLKNAVEKRVELIVKLNDKLAELNRADLFLIPF